jgi:hypothetical protein
MHTRQVIVTAVVVVVALATGYVLGFRTAWSLGVQAEFAARGVLATQMLNAIRTGKSDVVTTHLEGDVDGALLIGGDFVESSTRPLLPLMGIDAPANYEQYMSRIAAYRKANPRQTTSAYPEMQRVIDARVNRYAK